MVRVCVFCYHDLPREDEIEKRLGKETALLLAGDRRGRARIERLTGFCLLARMLPDADLRTVRRTDDGRPFFPKYPDVDFNLSHTDGIIACAVNSGGGRIGVDVERLGPRSRAEMERIAARWFSTVERETWTECPTEKRFLEIWTMKEAIAKRTGGGLRDLRSLDSTDPAARGAAAIYSVGDAILALSAPEKAKLPQTVDIVISL